MTIPDRRIFRLGMALALAGSTMMAPSPTRAEQEIIPLHNARIGYIASIYKEPGTLTVATIQSDNGKQTFLVVSADCLLDQFNQEGKLGRNIGVSIWNPRELVQEMTAVSVSNPSEVKKRAIISLQTIQTSEGNVRQCDPVEMTAQTGRILTAIDDNLDEGEDRSPASPLDFINAINMGTIAGLSD